MIQRGVNGQRMFFVRRSSDGQHVYFGVGQLPASFLCSVIMTATAKPILSPGKQSRKRTVSLVDLSKRDANARAR